MGKSSYLLILVYWTALLLLCFPLLKQSVLSYKLTQVSLAETKVVEQPLNQAEAVQPPTFSEILAFQGTDQAISGKLLIPSAEFLVPIYPTVTQESLLAGGGMLFPERSPEIDNMVLLGHHLGNQQLLFGQLLSLTEKDDLYLDYEEEVYHYQVATTKIIKETELSVLEETTEPQLTLITCDKPTQTDQRFVVTARLINRSPMTSEFVKTEQRLEKTTSKRNRQNVGMVATMYFSLIILGTLIILRLLREEEM